VSQRLPASPRLSRGAPVSERQTTSPGGSPPPLDPSVGRHRQAAGTGPERSRTTRAGWSVGETLALLVPRPRGALGE
jgi:hypothetical protein